MEWRPEVPERLVRASSRLIPGRVSAVESGVPRGRKPAGTAATLNGSPRTETPAGRKASPPAEEAICGHAGRGSMMAASPVAPFVVAQSDRVLLFLVVTLDAQPRPRGPDERRQRRARRQGRQEVFRWLLFARGPLYRKPLLGAGLGSPVVAMRRPESKGTESRCGRGRCALPPGDGTEASAPASSRACLDRDRLVCRVSREAFCRS